MFTFSFFLKQNCSSWHCITAKSLPWCLGGFSVQEGRKVHQSWHPSYFYSFCVIFTWHHSKYGMYNAWEIYSQNPSLKHQEWMIFSLYFPQSNYLITLFPSLFPFAFHFPISRYQSILTIITQQWFSFHAPMHPKRAMKKMMTPTAMSSAAAELNCPPSSAK